MKPRRKLSPGVSAPLLFAGRLVRSLVRRYLPNEAQHLFALTLIVGVVCGVLAVAFHLTIQAAEGFAIEHALKAPGSTWMFWTVLTPTLGGLIAGAALTWVVPNARGSGIPQVKQAFATDGGRVRFRDALGKFVISALQIGSGASLGREGPTVHICAGAASLLARATSLPLRQMRRLTAVGVAAGIAAAFNAPVAAVTFTIEEIVGKLDQTVLSGVVIAAALAAVIERGILGVDPVIDVNQTYGLDHPSSIALYAFLGVAAAFVSIAFTDGLLALRLWFRRLRLLPPWTHPAIGGLLTGILAVAMLHFLGAAGVTGGGYETLGRALAGQLGLRVLVALCGVKLAATLFSYSSGGAGGIFAPSLFVGAMLGGAVGHLDVLLLKHEPSQLGAFALVGMGAVFAGIIRAPITSVLIIFEMTGGYGLVLPLMLANMTSYVIARSARPLPIYDALLKQDGVSPSEAPSPTHPLDLEQSRVRDAMVGEVITLRADQSIAEANVVASRTSYSCIPIVDVAGKVLGAVDVAKLQSAVERSDAVATLGQPGHRIRSDAPLVQAFVRMSDLGIRQLLVVDPETEARLVGILATSDLIRAHARTATSHISGSTASAFPNISPSSLMVGAIPVDGSTPLPALAAQVSDGAFVMRDGREFAVLLPEQLGAAQGAEDWTILTASELARPAATVSIDSNFAALIAALREETAEGVVLMNDRGEPAGVVTRTALARALLHWYACRVLAPSA